MSKLDELYAYHEAVQQLDQLETQVKATPHRQKLNKLHSFLSEQQSHIKSTQQQIEKRSETVGRLSAQFDELQHQFELEQSEFEIMDQDEECTAAEMAESGAAIEALLEKITAIRKELFETIRWLEKAMEEYRDTFSNAAKAKKEYDEVRVLCEEELNASKPKLDLLQAEVEKRKQCVEPVLLEHYAKVKSQHAVPMARVENNQCSGCNMSLPTSVVKCVASGSAIIECENCGRMLYT